MINHAYYALQCPNRRGWIGHYTYLKDGARCTARVRDSLGMIIVFETKNEATAAAGSALCKALDSSRKRDNKSRPSYKRYASDFAGIFKGAI